MRQENQNIVVIGMGAICSHGDTVNEIWENLLAGENKIAPVNPDVFGFDPTENPRQYGSGMVAANSHTHAELAELAWVDKPARYDRHQLFALIAAERAMSSARLSWKENSSYPHQKALVVATGDGGLMEDFIAHEKLSAGKKLDPFSNIRELPNTFAGMLAKTFGFQGANFVHCTACAASAHAIMQGADLLKLGRADYVMVGGAEAAISPFGLASFRSQGALGTDSIPFQKGRNGFIMGEGAAMLVLTTRAIAEKNRHSILAVIEGYGATGDAADLTKPNPNGGARAAKLALDMAGWKPNDIEYINTHGTSTPAGDKAEIEGILQWSNRLLPPLVSSTKSYTGHLLGAAGALEAVLSVEMLQRDVLLPTRGLTEDTIDPSCVTVRDEEAGTVKSVRHVTQVMTGNKLYSVMSNSFGFGGTNASLIFSRTS